jgi:Glycine-zipper domain
MSNAKGLFLERFRDLSGKGQQYGGEETIPVAHMRKRQHDRVRARRTIGVFALSLIWASMLGGTAIAQGSDLYIYPAKGQSEAQQDKDRYDCHSWAVKQTGFDPSRPQTMSSNPGTSQQYQPSKPHVLQGAGRGAALGAVGGAITGDAGKGAAAGAAMGGLAGGFRRRDEKKQQAAQQQYNTQAAASSQRTSYNRAMAACLQARGYTVN